MASSRPVRIPRASSAPARVAAGAPERRPNTAGTQRAFRFAILYVLALAALDGVFVALDLTSSEANRPGLVADLQIFLGLAIVLAVGAVIFALTPAPRWVEVDPRRTVVQGRWGTRREFPPLAELERSVQRRYPAGFLASRPVEMVRLVDRRGRATTYQIQEGLLAPDLSTGAES
jgi:hypothetical protein